jgi:hypothetical protein
MTVRASWEHFWFRASTPDGLIAARIIVCVNALWLFLSRPLLPDVVRWPAPFWNAIPLPLRVRYGVVPLPFAVEMTLYFALIVCLALVAFGIRTRITALVAGLLTYHFAPLEDIFVSRGGPFFRGFTVIVLALLVVSFARPASRHDEPSPEYRWPLALIQLLFAFTYLMSGISKLRLTGIRWATGATFESIVLAMMIPDSTPPWAHFLLRHPALCAMGGVGGIAMDFAFIAAVFSQRAARIIVPLTLLMHIIIIPTLGVVFLSTPLLAIFIDWSRVRQRVQSRGQRAGIAIAVEPRSAPATE